MRLVLLAQLLFSFLVSAGQFAIVSGKGPAYVYKTDEAQSEVIDTLTNGQLLYCTELEGKKTNINYVKRSHERYGYIVRDRYKMLNKFPGIPVVMRTMDTIRLKKDSIEVVVTRSKFDKTKHKLTYLEHDAQVISLIDNKKYWGRDGGLPTSQYDKTTITIGQKMIALPQKALEGLYEPSLHDTEVNVDAKKNIIYIHSMNSDGAGAYGIVWKIEGGGYRERFVMYGF